MSLKQIVKRYKNKNKQKKIKNQETDKLDMQTTDLIDLIGFIRIGLFRFSCSWACNYKSEDNNEYSCGHIDKQLKCLH